MPNRFLLHIFSTWWDWWRLLLQMAWLCLLCVSILLFSLVRLCAYLWILSGGNQLIVDDGRPVYNQNIINTKFNEIFWCRWDVRKSREWSSPVNRFIIVGTSSRIQGRVTCPLLKHFKRTCHLARKKKLKKKLNNEHLLWTT